MHHIESSGSAPLVSAAAYGALSALDLQALMRVNAGKIPNRRAIRRLSMSRHIAVNAKAHIRLTSIGVAALTGLAAASLSAAPG